MELLGPYFFIRDSEPVNFVTGILLCAILLPTMALVFFKPFRVWKVALAMLAAILWILIGVIGRAINA